MHSCIYIHTRWYLFKLFLVIQLSRQSIAVRIAVFQSRVFSVPITTRSLAERISFRLIGTLLSCQYRHTAVESQLWRKRLADWIAVETVKRRVTERSNGDRWSAMPSERSAAESGRYPAAACRALPPLSRPQSIPSVYRRRPTVAIYVRRQPCVHTAIDDRNKRWFTTCGRFAG